MAQAGPAQVVTPEAVPLELQTAGLGSRFLALLIDWTVQGAALFALLLAAAALSTAAHVPAWPGGALLFFLVFAVVWGYPVAMETLWRGRSLGKAALGLRVVTREGGQVRFRHAAIRAALGLVDFVLTSGGAAVLSVLLTRHDQRLGDLAAGTLVLRERTGQRAPAPVLFHVPSGLEVYAASLDVSGLGADDYRAVRSFLVRGPRLPPHIRASLAAQLASSTAPRVRPRPPADMPAEPFLACVAAAYQRRQGVEARWTADAPSMPTASMPTASVPGASSPPPPAPPPAPSAPPPPPAPPSTGSPAGGFVPPA